MTAPVQLTNQNKTYTGTAAANNKEVAIAKGTQDATVNGKGGNDNLTVTAQNTKGTAIYGGGGNDTLDLQVSGNTDLTVGMAAGDNTTTINGNDNQGTVTYGNGTNTVTSDGSGNTLRFESNGKANDGTQFTANINDTGSQIEVAGGDGKEDIQLNGDTNTLVASTGGGADKVGVNGNFNVFDVRTGKGRDQVDVEGDGNMGYIHTGKGSDEVEVDGDYNIIGARLGDGDDRLDVDGDGNFVAVEGGKGKDEVEVDGDGNIVIADLGEGDDELEVNGDDNGTAVTAGEGDDKITVDGEGNTTLIDTNDGDGEDEVRVDGKGNNTLVVTDENDTVVLEGEGWEEGDPDEEGNRIYTRDDGDGQTSTVVVTGDGRVVDENGNTIGHVDEEGEVVVEEEDGDQDVDNDGDGEDVDNDGDGEDVDNDGDGEDVDNDGGEEDVDNDGGDQDVDDDGDHCCCHGQDDGGDVGNDGGGEDVDNDGGGEDVDNDGGNGNIPGYDEEGDPIPGGGNNDGGGEQDVTGGSHVNRMFGSFIEKFGGWTERYFNFLQDNIPGEEEGDDEPAGDVDPAETAQANAKAVDNLQNNFNQVDSDGDGVLTNDEIARYEGRVGGEGYKGISEHSHELMFASIDPGNPAWHGLTSKDLDEIDRRLAEGETIEEIAADLREQIAEERDVAADEEGFQEYVDEQREQFAIDNPAAQAKSTQQLSEDFGDVDANGDGFLSETELNASDDPTYRQIAELNRELMFANIDSGNAAWHGLSAGDVSWLGGELESGKSLQQIARELRERIAEERNAPTGEAEFRNWVDEQRRNNQVLPEGNIV